MKRSRMATVFTTLRGRRLAAGALPWLCLAALLGPSPGEGVEVRGRVVDSESGRVLPARVYLQSESGEWLHVQTAAAGGTAIPYNKNRGGSVEIHTTLSAHPFRADVPPGSYTVTVERGKEYRPLARRFQVDRDSVDLELALQRWTDMAGRGWYSGDTHVHRAMSELPNLVLAENLNVALPLNYWVTDTEQSPARSNRNQESIPPAKLIEVDKTHVIWPINTEYEIFTVKGRRHALGALFFLNYGEPLDGRAPPVAPILQEARRQGRRVLLDLDKHNWPWSMMVVSAAKVDLFELTNNHVWRTDFRFSEFYPEYAPAYMKLPTRADGGFTERAWIEFGFKNYYALLNCGFRIQPSAGTASGVHPVPLGFGRVYVHLPDGFDYDRWIEGLAAGRSFVTTGPMLTATFNDRPPGTRFETDQPITIQVSGQADSMHPIERVEIIVNGEARPARLPANEVTATGAYRGRFDAEVSVERTTWIAVRCFEKRPDGRPRFAHTAPVRVGVSGAPPRPRPEEVNYLIKRVEDEIARHQGVLSDAALAEYEAVLDEYRALLGRPSERRGRP